MKMFKFSGLYVSGIFVFVLSFVTTWFTFAQDQPCPLTMTVSHTPVQEISPADFDFAHFESRNLLFTLTIINPTADSASAILEGSIDIKLEDGAYFPKAASFRSRPFKVPPGGLFLTNRNLGREGSIPTEQFEFESEPKSRIQDIALSTGKFPAGTYRFDLTIKCVQVGTERVGDSKLVEFNIQNASRVELRSPRDGEATNDRPFFEFFNEADCGVLTIAEKTPEQSRDDAISHMPPMIEVELCGQNSYLYTGGRPLEEGKTYVWRVVGTSKGTGGAKIEIHSQIGLFTVSSSVQGSPESAILNQLEEMYGQRYTSIFEQIHHSGFAFTGQYTLNGFSLSLSDLLNLLVKLRDAESAELSFE
jgi:hypothetical protein